MSQALTFPAKFVAGIVAHINEEHRRELVDLAHGLAGQTWVIEAALSHIDKAGLDLQLLARGREETLRISFDAPLDKTTEFRPAVAALIQRARARLSAGGQEPAPAQPH
jgi:putative heme iron utilization protein